MQTRLSFAIATAMQPNILLMDEEIGAGDASFEKKVRNRLSVFYSDIDIMVIASHSKELIAKLCNKALLLKNGKQVFFGGVEEVLAAYQQS